jgi:hypothetical protein
MGDAYFLEQLSKLSLAVPRVALLNPKSENSPYSNFADANKNCYLLFNANGNEDSHYAAILLALQVLSGLFVGTLIRTLLRMYEYQYLLQPSVFSRMPALFRFALFGGMPGMHSVYWVREFKTKRSSCLQ